MKASIRTGIRMYDLLRIQRMPAPNPHDINMFATGGMRSKWQILQENE